MRRIATTLPKNAAGKVKNMTEIVIMKELFVALSEKKAITLVLKNGSSVTGCVNKFDGTSILLNEDEIPLLSIASIEATSEPTADKKEDNILNPEQGKRSTSIDINPLKSKTVHIRFLYKDVVEEDEGVLFDYKDKKLVLVTKSFKRVINEEDVLEIAEVDSVTPDMAITDDTIEPLSDYSPNRFESALIVGEKEVVESYFGNPSLLEAEGYSEEDATWISRIPSTQAPWKDDGTNRTYNQARRVFTYIKNRNQLAERLFHKSLENERTAPKLKEKAINTLIGMAEYESHDKLKNIYSQYKSIILGNVGLTLSITSALTRAGEYDLARSVIDCSDQEIDFSEIMFSLSFHEKHKDYDFSNLPGLDSLDERVTFKELRHILALPNKASCIQLLTLYSSKQGREESFFAILDLFLPYAKNESRIVEAVQVCLKHTADDRYLLKYLPQFPVLWLDNELAIRYLGLRENTETDDPTIYRLKNQCQRATQYKSPNNLEASIIQGNWNSFEVQRENDSILYSFGYSVEEARHIRAFDIETIRYGNKPAIERLLLFEGNKNHVAESSAGIDFLRLPEAVCRQLFPILLDDDCGDLVYELYNYSRQITRKLSPLKKEYLKALLLLGEREEYWKQIKEDWMNLELDSEMLIIAKSLAEEHDEPELSDLFSMFIEKKPFNEFELAIINGNVSKLRTLITDADFLLGTGYTTEEIRLIQESVRQKIDFTSDDSLSIANRLYVFQKNKNRSAEFYYKLALKENTELAASGLFSIYATESRFDELCSLYEAKLQDTALVIEVPGNKKAYMNALFQTKQYEKFYRLWETDRELLTINPIELLIVLLETNASSEPIDEIIHDQLFINPQDKELIIRCISLLLMRKDCENSTEAIFNHYFTSFEKEDISRIKEAYNPGFAYKWSEPDGNGIRGLIDPLTEKEMKEWIAFLFEMHPDNTNRLMILEKIIAYYEDDTDEFFNLINASVVMLSNNGANIPETLTKYRYPKFKDERERSAWLEEKISSLIDIDEQSFDLVCNLSEGMKDKSSLRHYLYSISNRKLPFELKYISVVSGLMCDLLPSEDESDSQALIELMRCIHNQMIYGRISVFDIVILFKVYIKLKYNNYAYIAYCSLHDNPSLDENQQNEISKLYEQHLASLDLSVFDVVSNALKQKSLKSIEQFSNIWKNYLRVSERDMEVLEELKDLYSQPENWSKEALESIAKSLICSPTVSIYWRLFKMYYANGSSDIRCNILFHQAQVENGSFIPALLAASDGDLFSQTNDILLCVIKAENLNSFEKDKEAISIVINKHTDWMKKPDVAYSFIQNTHANCELKKDARAWSFISELAMSVAMSAGIERDFYDLYKDDLENYVPIVNEKFLCELLLHKSTDAELLSSSYTILQQSSNRIPYKEILLSIAEQYDEKDISPIQTEILTIIRRNKDYVKNEFSLYEYYVTAVSEGREEQALKVINEFEKYYPDNKALYTIKILNATSKASNDEDILQIYNLEFEKIKQITDPKEIEKRITKMIPGEMYLESRGITVESALNYGIDFIAGGYGANRIRKSADLYSALDNVFDRSLYPGFVEVFLKCSFLERWRDFIEFSTDNKSINAIIQSNDVTHNFLMRKPYDVLKGVVLSVIDSEEGNEDIIERAHAIMYGTGTIYRSKTRLHNLQSMNDENKAILKRIFRLHIETGLFRTSGIIGTAILQIPNNEEVSEYIEMLGTKSLSLLFDHGECFNALMGMPIERALAIAEKYVTYFEKDSNNVFARFLRVKKDSDLVSTTIDNPFNSSVDVCKESREKYIKLQKEMDENDQEHYVDVQKYIATKIEYLYNAVMSSSTEDIKKINPSKTDYLSVITLLFNTKSIEDINEYIRKLDTSAAVPALCALSSLLEQYFTASNVASMITDREWKETAINFMYRCMRLGTITPQEKRMRDSFQQHTPFKRELSILKLYPTNRAQYPEYIDKMNSLRSACVNYAKYLAYNRYRIPYVSVDMKRFNFAISPYRNAGNTPLFGQRQQTQYTQQAQYPRYDETIETLVEKEHIANLIKNNPNVTVAARSHLSGCTLDELIGALKYMAEVKYGSQEQQDVFYTRNVIRWIYIKIIESEGYDHDKFIHILEMISEKDIISKQQWDFIYSNLEQYFAQIKDLNQLSKAIENDFGNLQNIGKISNNTIRFLERGDIISWQNIMRELSDIASISFLTLPENELINRLSKCRITLNNESTKKTAFERIVNHILRLINDQVMNLRHTPDLIIEIPDEQEGNIQNILWRNNNESGKLYSNISNIGGDDCHHVELVSTINMKKSKHYSINTIYSGERIPFSESFSKADLVDGKVVWNLDVSFYDSGKKKTISHEHKAFVQMGGERLKIGKMETGSPACGQDFVGRKTELNILRSKYSEIDHVPSMLIRGLKRSGKSSIRIRFAEELKNKNKLLVAQVDGQMIMGGSIKMAFCEKVLDSIMITYRRSEEYKDILENQFEDFRNKWEQKLNSDEWMSYLDSFYYELSRLFNKKILVILDEMESVFYNHRFESIEQEESLYAVLRSLIQNPENFVSFIFCGSDFLLISCLEQRRESQMFQTLHPIEVGQMLQGDIQDIFKLQSKKYDIQFTKEAVDTIWQYTQGLVWYAKLLAYLVIDNIFAKDFTVRKNVYASDIVTAVQMLLNGEGGANRVDLVDTSLSTPRAAIVRAMANLMPDRNIQLSVEDICNAVNSMRINGYVNPRTAEPIPDMDEKDVKSHLEFLEKLKFVDSNASRTRYCFTAELYRLFFRNDNRLHLFEERRS